MTDEETGSRGFASSVRSHRAWVCAAVVLAALLPLGGVTPSYLIPAVVVASLARLVTLAFRAPRRGRAAMYASAALWFAVAVILFQCIPLGPKLLQLVSKSAAAIWRDAEALAGTGAYARPLSLDPTATRFAAATAITTALTFEVWSRSARVSTKRTSLVMTLAAVLVFFAALGALHPLLGLTKLYGLVTPKNVKVGSFVLAPLLNPNHAAAAASAGVPLCLGLFPNAKTIPARLFIGTGAAICAGVALLTLSRGGVAVTLGELLVMIIVVRVGKRPSRSSRSRSRRPSTPGWLPMAIAGSAGVGGALYLGLGRILEETRNTDVSKIRIAFRAYGMVKDYPLGIGRGAFGSVFSAVQEGLGDQVRFTHVEHWPAQLVVEMGVVAAIVYVGLIALSLRRVAKAAYADPMYLGVLVALAGLVAHDLGDFSMEFAGVGCIAAALLGLLTTLDPATSRASEATADDARPSSERLTPVATVTSAPRRAFAFAGVNALAGVAFALVLSARGRTLDDDVRRVADGWTAHELREDEIIEGMMRHPADPYFPMVLGVSRLRSPEGGWSFARAVRLGPSRAQTHFWFARWFLTFGMKGQALAEYRTATRLSNGLEMPVVQDLLKFGASTDELASVCTREPCFDYAANALGLAGRGAEVDQFDETFIEQMPPAVSARLRRIERLRLDGKVAESVAQAAALTDAAPNSKQAWIARSKLAADPLESERILEAGIIKTDGDLDLTKELLLLRGKRLGVQALTADLEQYRDRLLSAGHEVAEMHALMGEIELRQKHPAQALRHFRDAAAAAASPAPYLVRVASLAESVGQWTVASEAWSALLAIHPDDGAAKVGLERVKTAANNAKQQAILAPASSL